MNTTSQVICREADKAGVASHEFASLLAVDGENVEGHVREVHGPRFSPDLRPRWKRVRQFVETTYGGPCKALFFLNVTHSFPYPFAQALRAAGFEVVPLKASDDNQLVDQGIKRVLRAMRDRAASVVVASHDGGFDHELGLLADGTRRVGLLALREFVSGRYQTLLRAGQLDLFDLEDEVHAFDGGPLPRLRAISLERFDPESFLTGVG
jgi:putative heme uptake system protein